MADVTLKINGSTHPDYFNQYPDWVKFRYTWEGGDNFKDQYLKSFSTRENPTDFNARKEITPIPSFATAAITDIKNAIFQRMGDITRVGGDQSYQNIISGKLGGVDLLGATMNYFIGNEILPELLFMGKIGVYVDMPVIEDEVTLNQTRNVHPYFYKYKTENIRNWRLSRHGEFVEYDMLLLRENILTYDDIYHLPEKDSVRYRLLTREDGVILVRFYDSEGTQINMDGEPIDEVIELKIKHIPFTIFELNQSLLQNIANHQIALLNLESSDISYVLLANFPFYIEQQSAMASAHLKNEESDQTDDREIEVGGTVGRSYGKELDPPSFIFPSSEPLLASIKKQEQIKSDIRTLVQLALSTVQPKYASAEAKQFDEHGLESGLSFIGLILEHGERQLAAFYSEYESSEETTTISYPERYSLKSDHDRLLEAEKLHDMMLKIPARTAQKAMSKLIVRKILDTKIPQDELDKIYTEIDQAEYITTDPDVIHGDLEKGLVSTETASKARGYDAKTEVPKAEKDHADRIKRINEAQSNDLSASGDAAKEQKTNSQNPDQQGDTHKPVRGEGNA